jgi:hypothetical protein
MAKRRRKRTPPIRTPGHASLKPDGSPKNRGSYTRRIEDIRKGLDKAGSAYLPPAGLFLFLYYGCEKLAKGIVGIASEWSADDAYDQDLVLLN